MLVRRSGSRGVRLSRRRVTIRFRRGRGRSRSRSVRSVRVGLVGEHAAAHRVVDERLEVIQVHGHLRRQRCRTGHRR